MKDLDKYVEYVIAQVGEGGHSKEDLAEDLKERGLNDNEILQVLDIAWREGGRREDETKQQISLWILSTRVLLPLILFVILLIVGGFGRYTFIWLIGGVITLLSVLFARKRFK